MRGTCSRTRPNVSKRTRTRHKTCDAACVRQPFLLCCCLLRMAPQGKMLVIQNADDDDNNRIENMRLWRWAFILLTLLNVDDDDAVVADVVVGAQLLAPVFCHALCGRNWFAFYLYLSTANCTRRSLITGINLIYALKSDILCKAQFTLHITLYGWACGCELFHHFSQPISCSILP